MGFKARARKSSLWYLTIKQADHSSMGSRAEVAACLSAVFPRLKVTAGLQDGFKHRQFEVAVDLEPSAEVAEVALLVHWQGRSPQPGHNHPLWPVLCSATYALGGDLRDAYSDAPVAIPDRARNRALPENELDRVYRVPAEPDGPLAGIDDVDWRRLRHAYGSATDVPPLLRALRSADQEVRNQAWYELYGNIYHERSVYQATVHAVPYLLALLADESTPDRPGLLQYLLDLSLGLPEDFEARQVPWVIAKGVPLLQQLIATDPELRVPAIYLLATLPRTAVHARPLLGELLAEEADPSIRANAAFAVGIAWKLHLSDLHRLEKSLASPHAGERLAAALAMHRADYVTTEVISLFFDVLADSRPYRIWAESCPWGSFDAEIIALDQLLRLDRAARRAMSHRFVELLAIRREDDDWPPAQDIALDLLGLGFVGRWVSSGDSADLSRDQRSILAAVAASSGLWRREDTRYLLQRKLHSLGLPSDSKTLAAWVSTEHKTAADSNRP